jgi:PIN domain nuclease of toxin-antitoxin system
VLDLLLVTHVLLWWLAGDTSLSVPAHDEIDDPGNNVFVSAASTWEIATKFRIGKQHGAGVVRAAF